MSTTVDREEIRRELTQDELREQLRIPVLRTVVLDGRELSEPCQHCGHWEHQHEKAVPVAWPLVADVEPDPAALRTAVRTVGLLVDVLAQRRAAKQLAELAEPMVLRYIAAVRPLRGGNNGGARLLRVHPAQPHEGAVEVAALVRLGGRFRALAASFTPAESGQWVCRTVRIL
ncbi:hypothetical protein GCM10009836_03270 [Pseudonocardia ailaonensis]|uniref:Uncharacterized protein n=1 Tax=Pseudonocardia ailaonensis TaxID=367279 RepID=A0ABN2MJR7_9PSEU